MSQKKKHQRQNIKVLGRKWDVVKHGLHGDAPEWCLWWESGEKYNNNMHLYHSEAWRKRCHCVGSLFSCRYWWATVQSHLMLWSTGEYCRMACFPQLKSYLKRNDQMLLFNKTMLLSKL